MKGGVMGTKICEICQRPVANLHHVMPKGGASMHLCTKCVLDLNYQLGSGDHLKPATPSQSNQRSMSESWAGEPLAGKI
jgi:ribosome-binding protein aMBF1 (putative translation factor)